MSRRRSVCDPQLFLRTFLVLFLRAARHPADSDGLSNRWCPGAGQCITYTMASVPLWASTATAECRLALRAVHFSSCVKAPCFLWSCCLCLEKRQHIRKEDLAQDCCATSDMARSCGAYDKVTALYFFQTKGHTNSVTERRLDAENNIAEIHALNT